jgi:ribokinase
MITIIGSVNIDLIAKARRLPAPGETVSGHGFSTAAGGKGANQALAATRAGARVALCATVGSDDFAGPATQLLEAAGTDLSRLRTVEGPTGTAVILVADGGENVIVVIEGANAHLSIDDAASAIAAMSPGDTLLMQLEVPLPVIDFALRQARTGGIRTILNIAPMNEEARALAALADIVIANETEFALLVGQPDRARTPVEAMMERQLACNQTIIVTRGAAGVTAAHQGALFAAEALAVDPVDTVGAGDTFCGYLAAGLDAGLDFEAALARAAVAGSLACLKPGAQPAIPFAADVETSGT